MNGRTLSAHYFHDAVVKTTSQTEAYYKLRLDCRPVTGSKVATLSLKFQDPQELDGFLTRPNEEILYHEIHLDTNSRMIFMAITPDGEYGFSFADVILSPAL